MWVKKTKENFPKMSYFLRLVGRMNYASISNSVEAPCMACISLRTGWRMYSTNPLLRASEKTVKRKKKWKKKKNTDSEVIHEEQFELTEVIGKHLQNLRTSESVSVSQNPKQQKIFEHRHFEHLDKKHSVDVKSNVQYKSLNEHVKEESVNSVSHSSSGKPRTISSNEVAYASELSKYNKAALGQTRSDSKTKTMRKKRNNQMSTEDNPVEQFNRIKPQTSFQTSHFDPHSREKAKQIFAYKGDKLHVISLPTTSGASVSPTETSESDSLVATDQLEDTEEVLYDEKEWENMRGMRRKKTVSNLLSFDQYKMLEMERDRHLEKLEEPQPYEENDLDSFAIDLNDSFSVEGVITKQAKEKNVKLKQKQQTLEMKKILRSRSSEEWLARLVKAQKTQVFNEQLKSYVDACVSCGLLDRAISDLQFYRREFRSARILTPITDVEIYNILLRGLAKLSDEKESTLEQTRKVFSWIREDDLKPSMESFCLCLASIGIKSDYDLMMASFIVKDMRAHGFDVQDAFNQCTFLHNEKHKLNKIFRLLIPGFKPNRPTAGLRYEGSLLENLNDPVPVSEMAQINSLAGAVSADDVMAQAETQFSREIDGYIKVESVFPQTKLSELYWRVTSGSIKVNRELLNMEVVGNGAHASAPDNEQKIADTVHHWRKSIKEQLIRKRNDAKRRAFLSEGIHFYPFLCLFPLDDYVDILTMEAQHLAMQSQHYSPDIHSTFDLARHVNARYITHLFHNTGVFQKLHKIYGEYINNLMDPNMPCHNQRLAWRKIQNKFRDGNSIELPNKKWSYQVLKMVGKELMDVLLAATTINANMFKPDMPEKMVKGFLQVNRMRDDKISREFMPHPVLVKLMNPTTEIVFPTKTLPMLCPPVPYLSSTYGGDFMNTVETVRFQSSDQESLFKEMSPDAGPVFDALNILGACAWQINQPVLEVAIKVFRDGGDTDVDIPVLPANLQVPVKPKDKEINPKEIWAYKRERRQYAKRFGEATSLWWTMLYKLSIANKYKNETFWFPLNMDFRSRTYTVAPHLNHQGDDVNRGLIQFAKGKALGKEGFNWLKIHLVNLTGLKKRSSNADRLTFCDELMPSILDSADNPLTGRCWWRESEEPWQTLATCMEIAKAVRSGSPETFVSRLPVHQDGSCNGLQHYAALGRDELGAKSVNLHPLEVPSDVYTEVLELVNKEIERDIREKTKDAHLAKISQKYIERKVIKQSVMTTVYGVTVFGARHQIARQLKYKNLDEKHMLDVSMYITRKTFNSLNEMFTSAKLIQDWFNECAKLLSSLDMRMEWVTPLNFPIIQPYTKAMCEEVALNKDDDNFRKVDGRKQVNAFAPNFVHSLDATHMMLTALDCHRRGITFVSVHDCFWTHPAYVGIMNKVTREQFVSLYRQPVLNNLSQHLLKKCVERAAENTDIAKEMETIKRVLQAVPGTGNFELENVLDSTYFFS